MYLLDTDHLIVIQRQTEREWEYLRSRMVVCDSQDFYLSVVSFHEQILGANTFITRARTRDAVVRGYQMMEQSLIDFNRFPVVPFDQPAALEFARQREAGVRIGTMDLRIASIALSHRMTVLTRNTVDFERVPGLSFEDWTLPK